MCYQSQLELNSPNSAERVHTHSDPAPLDAPTQSPVTDVVGEQTGRTSQRFKIDD